MKSPMAAALAPCALLFAAACSLAPAPAQAAQTFAYRLLPGESTLRYATQVGDEHREIYAGVSGTFSFILNDDDTIAASTFDLTIEGPFYDGTLAQPDVVPFAAGDNLADYLAVDFANETGFTFAFPLLSGQPGPAQAIVGPDAGGSPGTVVLGKSYYHIQTIANTPTIFTFESAAGPGIGGSFQLFPDTEVIQSVSTGGNGLGGDVVIPMLRLEPNVALIPEPTSTVLLIAGALVLGIRRRR